MRKGELETHCNVSQAPGKFFIYIKFFFIAICAKVWNRVNLSIFAFSEVGTCSASIAITSLSIIIIFVVLESPN